MDRLSVAALQEDILLTTWHIRYRHLKIKFRAQVRKVYVGISIAYVQKPLLNK